jgi:glycosyltransferase involved in cell wall biosynthesis
MRRTLAALDFADEIVVVDMFSTDGTAELVKEHPKGRLIQRNGYIYENVNAGFDAATGDWVMRLDSDEVPTAELGIELRERIASAPDDLYGFWAPSRTYWFGRWVRYGPAYDERSTIPGERFREMVFRRGTARYECKHEHERLNISGRYEFLQNRYDHYSIDSVSHWVSKVNYYTDKDLERLDVSAFSARYEALAMIWGPVKQFAVFFLKRKGYKDGALGIVACAGYALSRFLEHAKRWERLTNERRASAA